jgi:hypothetical protein
MKSFEAYFSDSAIIEKLCRMRLRQAHKRRKISSTHSDVRPRPSPEERPLPEVFPPRREWHVHRPPRHQRLDAEAVNLRALFKAMQAGRRAHPDAPWVRRLNEVISRIRSRALSPAGPGFAAPRVILMPKKKGGLEMRPIAIYPVEDRIIQSQTARYLIEYVNLALDPSSIAFRSSAGRLRPPQHHDTVGMILEMNERCGRDGLYEAEADLLSCYDCVSHAVARECVDNVVAEARILRGGRTIDPRAFRVLDDYLGSYAFVPNVSSLEDLVPPPGDRQQEPHVTWPFAVLSEFHPDLRNSRVGIAQGGALSGIVINAILHQADQAVRRVINATAAPVLYLRYVDDMILLSPCPDACTMCYQAYLDAVTTLKLPVHAPHRINEYGPDYWKHKSKSPFLWGDPGEWGGIPWISFLGYDLRFDDLVRVRKSSVLKHRQRIVKAVDESVAMFAARRAQRGKFGWRLTDKHLLRELARRLYGRAVGRATMDASLPRPRPKSWAEGFRGLRHGRALATQLCDLDRHLERQLHRAERKLRRLHPLIGWGTITRYQRKMFRGFPFSYAGQFVSSQSQHEDNHHSE